MYYLVHNLGPVWMSENSEPIQTFATINSLKTLVKCCKIIEIVKWTFKCFKS